MHLRSMNSYVASAFDEWVKKHCIDPHIPIENGPHPQRNIDTLKAGKYSYECICMPDWYKLMRSFTMLHNVNGLLVTMSNYKQ